MIYEKSKKMGASLTEQLLAKTPCLSSLAQRLAAVAAADVPMLLTGETGTGKTHLARLIHDYSHRREQRLVVVSCGALAPSLLMSELFGHARSTLEKTNPVRVGRFEAAGSGTLLLDEIDALSLQAQAALVRAIETGFIEPVGSKESRWCQARILTTCNGDLERAVAEKRFRGDLYCLLNEFAFHLPPLRRRKADIAALAQAMVVCFADKFHKTSPTLHPETPRVLQSFPWPGNIRQLENCIQQAVLVSSGNEIRVEHLPEAIRASSKAPFHSRQHGGPIQRTTLRKSE